MNWNKNYSAENRQFKCTELPENTSISPETSPIENMDAIVRSQPTYTYTNEIDFHSTLLDDETLFLSHIVNALIDREDNDQNTTRNKKTTTANETTNNSNIYQNQQHRQTVNSTDLTPNLDPLNTTLPILPTVNTSLQRQNSAHFNTEPVILIS